MTTLTVRSAAVIALVCSWWAASRAISPVVLETHVVLRVEAVTVGGTESKGTGVSRSAEVGPDKPVTVDLRVPWDSEGRVIDVRLVVALSSASPSGGVTLRCTSTASASGRTPVRARRDFQLADDGAGLFEVYGDGAERLVLTLQGERVERAVVRKLATPGDPVRFVVVIEGVAGERSAALETNEFRSFVGQSVEYSFQQGPGDGRESIRLVLLPVSIAGDLITIQVEISGVLPGPNGPTMLNRTERIVASRRSTTPIAATVGTPPSGYRFQVTPDF